MEVTAILSAIKRFAVHDGPGIRTTAFLKGCPLRCRWCHNPEGMSAAKQLAFFVRKCVFCGECARVCSAGAHEVGKGKHFLHRDKCLLCGKCADVCPASALTFYGRTVTPEDLAKELSEDAEFYSVSGGGITVSGGEPLLWPEFVRRLFVIIKRKGINTAVDTCGAVPRAAFDAVMPLTDIFLFDVKHADPERHVWGTGKDNALILDNLRYIDEAGAKTEIRYPLIPDFNDDEQSLKAAAEIIGSLKNTSGVRVLPYHNLAGSKYAALETENRLPEKLPDDGSVVRAKDIFAARANVINN